MGQKTKWPQEGLNSNLGHKSSNSRSKKHMRENWWKKLSNSQRNSTIATICCFAVWPFCKSQSAESCAQKKKKPRVPLSISSGCGIKCGELIFFGPSGLNSLSKCLHDPNKIRLFAIRCLRASQSQKLLIQIAKVGARLPELEFSFESLVTRAICDHKGRQDGAAYSILDQSQRPWGWMIVDWNEEAH